jgi:hypothetical protein
MRLKWLRMAAVQWFARRLQVPIKIRDSYWGEKPSRSHVVLKPDLAVAGEAEPC